MKEHEQKEVLDLLYTVFRFDSGDFERSFMIEASPRYREGDTLGAWCDGKLVSTVNIHRHVIRSLDDNEEYLCGFVTNVATLEKYRRRGFSRRLLRLAIEKMEQNTEFDLSLLGTGQQNHYIPLGWESMDIPMKVVIEWKNSNSINNNNVIWRSAVEIIPTDRELLLKIYSNNPRKYQFDRLNESLIEHWMGWVWKHDEAIVYILNEVEPGYVVISKLEEDDGIYVSEWRAPNIDVERKLLKAAAEEIQRRQKTNFIYFEGLPQYIGLDELIQWGKSITIENKDNIMIRNIRLPEQKIERIKEAYGSGSAACWHADIF